MRKALVGHISATLHEALQFPKKDKTAFAKHLADLGQRLNGMKSSFGQAGNKEAEGERALK